MTTCGDEQRSEEDVPALLHAVNSLPPLPRLSGDEHRAASDRIASLLQAVSPETAGQLDFHDLMRTASHLREIGDPSAAEELALMGADCLLEGHRDSDGIALLNLAGLSCFDQGAMDDAVYHFTRALSLIPSPDEKLQAPVILVNQATAFTEMGNFEQALLLYERTLHELDDAPSGTIGHRDALLPEQVRGLVMNNIGWVLLRSARAAGNDHDLIARAQKAIDAALALPLHPRTRLVALGNSAEARIMRGDLDSAESILDTVETACQEAAHTKMLPDAYRRRAQLWAVRGDFDIAIDWAKKTMHASIEETNRRQELRIVEVFLDILRSVTAHAPDPVAALETAGASVVTQLIALLESKDTYTGGSHSRRVAELSRHIAARLIGDGRAQQRWCKRVEMGGLFHDVGKLRIPWSLLNRVSPLSARDWQLLKGHTSMGESILRDLGLWSMALVAGGHHERPDGRGYPRGDTRATLESAIVAAADAFDAMTSSSRIYARPKTPDDALEIVQAGSGTQFNPEVSQALVAVLSRN